MRKILFVCALSKELKIISQILSRKKVMREGFDIKTLFFTTWIWNYNTILNLTKFLQENEVDFLVNIWVCGFDDKTEKTDDKNFIQVARIFNLANKKELIVPQVLEFWKLESIACSETPIFDKKEILGEKFVDMESYWIEMVCDNFSIPRIILKVPVDKIWEETKNFSIEKALGILKENIDYEKLFLNVIEYLKNVEEKVNFERYFEFFSFTFSEKEIFKKVYYKIENKEILTKLFENWKKLDKKESKKFLSKFQKS